MRIHRRSPSITGCHLLHLIAAGDPSSLRLRSSHLVPVVIDDEQFEVITG